MTRGDDDDSGDAPTDRCRKCRLGLPRGASHADADACVVALQEELLVVATCDACDGEMGDLCTSCFVKKAALNKAGQVGVGLYQKLLDHMAGKRREKRREK